MQPEQPQANTSNPNPQYDFIMNAGKQPKKNFSLPKLNLPRPVKLTLAGIVALFVIIVLSSIFFGSKTGTYQPLIDAMARAQEITRVSALAQQNDSQDQIVQNLAATVQTALSSQNAQLSAYLKTNKATPSTKALAIDQNKATDAQLQAAAQNNNLATVYETYLKQNLATYKNDLSTAYQKAGPKGKVILSASYNSVQVLLANPPLSSS